MKELFFHLLQFFVCACEIVLCPPKVAKRLSFFLVSQNEWYRYSLWNTPMATCSVSILQIRKCLRSGTFVGYGLINDYSGPSDWPTIIRSCFEMWCLCTFIVQCFCTSFKGRSMWKQCDSAFQGGQACRHTKTGRGKARKICFYFKGFLCCFFFCFNSPWKCVMHIVSSRRRFGCSQMDDWHFSGWLRGWSLKQGTSMSFARQHCVSFPKTVPSHIKVENKKSAVCTLGTSFV